MTRLIRALLLIAVLALLPLRGRAQSAAANAALAQLWRPASFDTDPPRRVERWRLSGDPRALPIIVALHDGKLYVRADHALFIKQPTTAASSMPRPASRRTGRDGERPEAGAR